MIGQVFGKLTIVSAGEAYVTPCNGKKQRQWVCKCECGKELTVRQANLKSGRSAACGGCPVYRLIMQAEMFNAGARSNECILYTGSKTTLGYGHVGFQGKTHNAHLVMLKLIGKPLPPGMITRHKCRVRHCINPEHLEFGSDRANALDMFRDGTVTSKLDELNVVQIIRYRSGGMMHKDIASMYEISRTHVSTVCSGKRWRHVHEAIAAIGIDELERRLKSGERCYDICRELELIH